MQERQSFHMTPAEFRTRGHQVIEWIASYMERVEELPVLSRVQPGEIRDLLPGSPPLRGEAFDDILADLDRVILPGVTHWQSPRFFAYFPANASGPAILGDLVSSGLGVQGMLWQTSPACTELETHVLDWLAEMLDLPECFRSRSSGGGVIQDTASTAALCALVAARERSTGYRTDREGCDGRLTVYTSTQAHSSIEKAVRIAGLGSRQLRQVAVDQYHAMQPADLEVRLEADRAEGLTPCMVVATVGTTSSTAIDPLEAIGAICRRYGVWLHVDAAMSGIAALCPEHRWIHDGLGHADSYCTNPHKWMFTNFDCDAFYVADRQALVRALSILPEYLRNRPSESGAVLDYRDWQVALGRRFRSLKLWFVIRHYGVEGLQHHLREHVALTRELVGLIEEDPRFELAAPAPLNLICFRHPGGDQVNQAMLDRVNASGRAFLTHTRLEDRLTLRMSIGQTHTRREHVMEAWDLLCEAAAHCGTVSDG